MVSAAQVAVQNPYSKYRGGQILVTTREGKAEECGRIKHVGTWKQQKQERLCRASASVLDGRRLRAR